MPRVKLIFEGFGIANCWYLLDQCMHETVDNVTTDLFKRFGVVNIGLEMDGYKFLGDGLTRQLFKDNDEITVRALCSSKIKESSVSDDLVDLIDSADEYESSVDFGEESDAAVLKDDVSFHLSVDATCVIQDSSDGSSISLVDAEMDMVREVPEPRDLVDESLVEKQVSVARELNLVKDTGIKAVHSEDEGDLEIEKERYYDGFKKDTTIVIKKTIDNHDKSKYKCFYGLADILKDMNGKWVADYTILNRLKKTFWTKYGYDTWKGYLKAGEKMNFLKVDYNAPRNRLFLMMTEKMCWDILNSVDSNPGDLKTYQASKASKPAIKVIEKCLEPVITVSNNETSDLGTALVQSKTVQPIIPVLPSFPITNCYQQNNTIVPQKLIPALPGAGYKPTGRQPATPAPPEINSHGIDNEQIVVFVPSFESYYSAGESYQSINKDSHSALTNLLPEDSDKKKGQSETWGINDSFFGKNKMHSNSLKKDASVGSSDKNDKSIQPQEDFSKSKNLTEQYKCFIDLAKYCEDFRPEEWIPGNVFINNFPGIYLKYGQCRWKTYLEWGKKLKLLDFRLINNELHVKMSQLMRRMIISLFNSQSKSL